MKKLTSLLVPAALDSKASVAMLLLRLVAGSAMVLHSQSKIRNPFGWMGADSAWPGFMQALAAVSEFGGGVAWMVGALTPLASLGLFCTMAVAVHSHLVLRGDPFVKSSPTQKGSYELALLYLVIAVVLVLVGPGRYSVDARLKERS